MSAPSPPVVALAGMCLEANAFSAPAVEADFRERCYLEGDAVLREARAPAPRLPTEASAFVRTMDATGPWTALPTVLADCEPSGPVEHAFFEATVARMIAAIEAAPRVDAVYVANHGAMLSTASRDPDGDLLARVRAAVGPGVPVVVTLDLHANLSERMVESADLIVGYQTNPHVDMAERGEEAALALRLMLAGMRPRAALVRLPIVAPTVSLLTRAGPYAEVVDLAQRRRRELGGAILNASVFGGFAYADSPKTGVSVVVTARADAGVARALADEIATEVWARRDRFRADLTPLDDAVARAVRTGADPSLPALILADVADNPGGGATGSTTWLLAALVAAGARGVLCGCIVDPELAAEAHALGVGARFEAVFNRAGETEYSRRFATPARVLAIADGELVGRRGYFAGRRVSLGPTAALGIGGEGGIVAVLASARCQTADPAFFEHLGLDPGAARVVCVKSRGHFRAGFDVWFAPEQVVEVDAPGLTSPVLSRLRWTGLPRPVLPLDPQARWAPAVRG